MPWMILGCGAKLDVVCFFFGKNELQNWYEESMKNVWNILKHVWLMVWSLPHEPIYGWPSPNKMLHAMACCAQGCFHRWTCPALKCFTKLWFGMRSCHFRWAHWTSDWTGEDSPNSIKLPHPFGPWNLWRPFLGCRNIQSFSQFFWVMELTSIHHRFPQHFPMKAPQKRSPLRSPLMMLEWAAWIRAWVCTDVHIWSRRRERRSWIGFNGTVTMIYIMMGFNGYQWDMNGIFILISKFGCTPPKLCLFCNIWNFGCEFVLCRVWPMPSCWIPTGFSCEAQTLNVNLRVNGQSVNPVAPNTFAPGGADDQKKPWPSHGVSPWWKPLENEFHRYLGPV